MIALLLATALTGSAAPAPSARAWCSHVAKSASTIAEAKLSGISRIRIAAAALLVDDEHERGLLLDLISLAYDGNAGDVATPADLAAITYTACMKGD